MPPDVIGLGIAFGLPRSDRTGQRDLALELTVAEFMMMRRLSLDGGVDLDNLDRHPLQTEESAASRSSTHNRDSRNLSAIDSLFADPWDRVSRWKL